MAVLVISVQMSQLAFNHLLQAVVEADLSGLGSERFDLLRRNMTDHVHQDQIAAVSGNDEGSAYCAVLPNER